MSLLPHRQCPDHTDNLQLLGGLRPSFFLAMWFELLFQWPDELPEQASVPQLSLEAVAIDLRQCRYLEAERRLRARSHHA